MQESINIRQGNMSLNERIFTFTQLSKYAPLVVADYMDKMKKFVKGVRDLVLNECMSLC